MESHSWNADIGSIVRSETLGLRRPVSDLSRKLRGEARDIGDWFRGLVEEGEFVKGETFVGFMDKGDPRCGATAVSRPAREPLRVCICIDSKEPSSPHRCGAGAGRAGGEGVLMPSSATLPLVEVTELEETIGVKFHFLPIDLLSTSTILVLLVFNLGRLSVNC
jgi:hypothetical protein